MLMSSVYNSMPVTSNCTCMTQCNIGENQIMDNSGVTHVMFFFTVLRF